MYTDEMRKAFREIHAPAGFSVDIIDNEFFITIKANAEQFLKMYHDQKIEAVQYLFKLKKAFENCGATVLIVRTGLSDDENG